MLALINQVFNTDAILAWLDLAREELIASFLVILIFYSIKSILTRLINRRLDTIRKRYLLTQTVAYINLILTLSILAIIWIDQLKSVVPALSLVAGAALIANKEMVMSLSANLVIFSRGLFQVGDRVQIGETIGDVVETGPFFVTLAEVSSIKEDDFTTGRIVRVPNNFIFIKTLVNYSKANSLIWNEIQFEVEEMESISEVKKLVLSILMSISYQFDEKTIQEFKYEHLDIIFIKKEPEIFFSVKDGKKLFTMRYICKFYNIRETEDIFWDRIASESKNLKTLKIKGIS